MADEPGQAPAPDAVVPTTEPAPAPDATAQAQAQTQSEVQEYKAKIAKLEAQVQGLKGTAAQRLDWEAELKRIHRRLDHSLEYQDLLAKRFVSGDPDAASEVQSLRQRHTESESQDSLETVAWEEFKAIGEEIGDAFGFDISTEDGKAEVDKLMRSRAELNGIQSAIQQAYEPKTQTWRPNALGLLRAAAKEARAIRRQADATRNEKAREEAKKQARQEAEKETKDRLKEAGAMGMPSGSAAGGGGGTHESYVESLKKGAPLPASAEIDRIVAERLRRIAHN